MSVIRDMYCTQCETVQETISDVSALLECHTCSKKTLHKNVCNGGTKTRYRCQDWPSDPAYYRGQTSSTSQDWPSDPAYYRGQTSSTSPTCHVHDEETGEETPNVDRHTGQRMDSDSRFSVDSRAEKRDRIEHDTDRKRGTLPLTIDQGSHAR